MRWLDDWRERRNREWWERWDREHRWDRLATYNAERYRGIVHTPEWDAAMAEEQRAFNREQGYESERGGFPIRLDPA
jgi:hypothetical protein